MRATGLGPLVTAGETYTPPNCSGPGALEQWTCRRVFLLSLYEHKGSQLDAVDEIPSLETTLTMMPQRL